MCMQKLAEDCFTETILTEDTEEPCKGLIYRYKENNFINSNGEIVFTKRFVPMKKLSCKGCKYCGGIEDSMSENIASGYYPIYPEDIENGDLVELITVVTSVDYETGYADDWEEQFVKVERNLNDIP